jgi:dienelactone hydrolase
MVRLMLIAAGIVATHSGWSSTGTPKVYQVDGRTYEGRLYEPQVRTPGPQAAVLVFHDFLGLGDNTHELAKALTARGYRVFAADLYGQGRRPRDFNEANAMAQVLREQRTKTLAVAQAALNVLKAETQVDPTKIFSMGTSVGGHVALEVARSGAPIAATVSLWGILENKEPTTAKNIRGPVLILRGSRDPLQTPEQLMAFEREMDAGERSYSIRTFGGVAHAYTVPGVGHDPKTGFAYDLQATEASWEEISKFFAAHAKLKHPS